MTAAPPSPSPEALHFAALVHPFIIERPTVTELAFALDRFGDDREDAGWNRAHEPAPCGHARANYKDPAYSTPEYRGNEKCEACCFAAEAVARERAVAASERDAREKCEAALRGKDAAMGVLFERLDKAGVDCSDLIS